jgi:hypothetical protein
LLVFFFVPSADTAANGGISRGTQLTIKTNKTKIRVQLN